MKYSFIDYENLKGKRLKSLNFNENDIIYLFYTNSDTKIDMDILEHMTNNSSMIKFYHVKNGAKNALDFQMSTFIGYIIGKHKNEKNEYYIYSEDRGFDYLIGFWKDRYKINISRVYETTNMEPEDFDSFAVSTITREELINSGIDYCYIDKILYICSMHTSKNNIHNEIERLCLNSKIASRMYRQIKPLLISHNYC